MLQKISEPGYGNNIIVTSLSDSAINKSTNLGVHLSAIKIEVLDSIEPSTSNATTTLHGCKVGTAKLLENCEIHNKSGKKLLDESRESGLKVNKSEGLTNGEVGASNASEIEIIEKILL